MSILRKIRNSLFGTGNIKVSGMTEISTPEELQAQLEANDTLLLFKHSTTCPISASALGRVQELIQSGALLPPICLVKVIESRPLSNHIAAQFNVTHQSPQALLIQQGTCTWNASHGSITADAISQALNV